MNKTKICSKCKKEFPATNKYFANNRNNKDHLEGICKKCKKQKYIEYKNKTINGDKNKKCNICNQVLNKRKYFHINKENKDGYSNTCKICEDINTKLKHCSKCKREFPATLNYFHKDKYNKDGLTDQCKECRTGNKLFNKVKPKDGYKFCIKCNKELPINIQYFPPDKTCVDGLRNVCRECGKDGHYMDDDYVPIEKWEKEKIIEFIKLYPHYTNEELIEKYYPNETLKSLTDRAYKLGNLHKTDETMGRVYKSHSEKLSGENNPNYGKPMEEEIKRKISLARIGKYSGVNSPLYGIPKTSEHRKKLSINKKKLGQWKGNKNPRHIEPLFGERNGRWEGGIKDLYFDLRDKISEWKEKSMEFCNYRCIVTGDWFDNIHHLYNFKFIVEEVFNLVNLPKYKTIGEYSECERYLIINKLNELHIKYGLGVCLRKDIHKLFHDNYGYSNNNKEQFEEFCNRYYNGEFTKDGEHKY